MAWPEPQWKTHWRGTPPAPRLPFITPDRLWPRDLLVATRVTLLPVRLQQGRYKAYNLNDPLVRLEVYSALLVHGTGWDLWNYLDANLLTEAFDELLLPEEIRAAWQPLADTWTEGKNRKREWPFT